MKILITGDKGQLGQALHRKLVGHQLFGFDLPEYNIVDGGVIRARVEEVGADLIIHCAAYTNVDGCAKDPQLAYQVNGFGTQQVALAAAAIGAEMVYISSNEVFDGSNRAGYQEWLPLSANNPYGQSKAAGEALVRHILPRSYIVRTAWLYGHTGRNFIHAILNRAQQGLPLRVVVDEIGNPTWVDDLAEAVGKLIETHQYGSYHFVNEGSCSRWAFAQEILRLANLDVPNSPILGSEFNRASTPPVFGALHNIAGRALGIELRPWKEALAAFIAEM